jgi:Fur family transcriptional regulator, ferric uptake regulator
MPYLYLVQIKMRQPDIRTYYIQYLRQRKLRATTERFAVLDAAVLRRGHFDADQLYLQMKTAGSTVSRATVYSALETMRASGILARYRFSGRPASYELTYGVPRHHHIICTLCGAIEEFVDKRVDRLARDAAASLDHRLEDAVLHMYGTCPTCRTP